MTADELPEGWTLATLADLISPSSEKVEPEDRTDSPYLSLEHIEAHSNRIIGQGTGADVKSTKAVFRSGDVLYGKLRPYLNKVAIPDFEGICSTDILVFRCVSYLDNRFLLRFLSRQEVVNFANHHSSGVQLPRISFKELGALEVPLPPLAEQRRIVAAVERILGKVSAARARLERVPTTLKRFRQAVLAAACSGGRADELSPNWRTVTLGEVIDGLKYGTSKKSEYETKGVPILRIPNVSGGQISHDDMKYSELEPAEYEQLRLRAGDVLMIRSNGSVSLLGKTALVSHAEADFAYAGYLIRIRPNDSMILPTYLNAVLGSEAVRRQIEMPARSTSGVNNINSDEVRALEFALPPLAEQQEIIRRVSALFARADAIEAWASSARKRVESLTQAVLAKAFRGELVPTEAELARRENRPYESAGELLERIRASAPAPATPSRTPKLKAK